MKIRAMQLRALAAASGVFALIGAACGDQPLAAEFNVDPAGATLSLLGGVVEIVVPPGAVDRRVTISAVRRTSVPTDSTYVQSSAVDLSPDGLAFAVACTLTVRYESLVLPPGMKPGSLHVRRLDETSGDWLPVAVTSVDTTAKRVSAVLNGFSSYALFGSYDEPPPPDTSYPNQPAGFSPLYERPMSALSESNWGFRDYSVATNNVQGTQIAIVNQPGAPRSQPGVLQFTYPAGWLGGGEPAKTWREFPTGEFTPALYMSLWVRFSDNWDGHLSSVNKIVYWQFTVDPSNRARLYLLGRGSNSQNLRVDLVTQGTPIGDQRLLPPNLVPNAQFVRGQWHRVEAIIRSNTGSNFDGQVHVWLDGTKVTEYLDVIFSTSAENRNLTGFEITPVWGGTGDQLGAQPQYLWVDHIYLGRGQ